MAPSNDDSQVATQLAVLTEAVKNLMTVVNSNHADVMGFVKDHETRLRALEESNTEIKARMTTFQMLQAAYTTIGTAIAAIIGKSP